MCGHHHVSGAGKSLTERGEVGAPDPGPGAVREVGPLVVGALDESDPRSTLRQLREVAAGAEEHRLDGDADIRVGLPDGFVHPEGLSTMEESSMSIVMRTLIEYARRATRSAFSVTTARPGAASALSCAGRESPMADSLMDTSVPSATQRRGERRAARCTPRRSPAPDPPSPCTRPGSPRWPAGPGGVAV